MTDLERLQAAEQKLLSALEAAHQVVALLGGSGSNGSVVSQQELERLCSGFLTDVQDSQVALLQLAERHQQPLPFQNNDYRQRLQLTAARQQVAAAEAQLAALGAGAGAAGVAQAAGGGGGAAEAAAGWEQPQR